MTDNLYNQIHSLQSDMANSVGDGFDECDIDHLRAIIRITVEFNRFVQEHPDWATADKNSLNWQIDTIRSGIDSFVILSASYEVLVGTLESGIGWERLDVLSFRETFLDLFSAFLAESNFERKCRHLLDLFKLQIAFSGIMHR